MTLETKQSPWWIAGVILAVFCLLRFWCWPLSNEHRDGDELGYLQGGLLALEGMQPAMRHTPAGPQTWLTFVYGGFDTMRHAWESTSPGPLRVFGAMESSLFRLYRDSDGLRQFHLWTTNLLTGLILVVLLRSGRQRAGEAGGILWAGLLLALPIGAAYGVMAHPYALAWALGALALATAGAKGKTGYTGVLAGAIWGLAIACRLEMVVLAPVILLEVTEGEPFRKALATGLKLVAAAVLSFVPAAPWFLAGLMGGLRNLVAIGIFKSGNSSSAALDHSMGFLWEQGWLLPLAAAVLFAGAAVRENGRGRLYAAVIIGLAGLILLVPPREVRYAVPLLLALSPACLRLLERIPGKVRLTLCTGLLAGPCWMTVRAAVEIHDGRVADPSTEWIEHQVPAGSPVYTSANFNNPLPTARAADRLWDEVRATHAWQKKVVSSARLYGFSPGDFPRAFTEEPMILEIGLRRRWFLLGASRAPETPRYDIQVVDSIAFGPPDMAAMYLATGGTLVIRGREPADTRLGQPVAAWRAANGTGVFIYQRERTSRKP